MTQKSTLKIPLCGVREAVAFLISCRAVATDYYIKKIRLKIHHCLCNTVDNIDPIFKKAHESFPSLQLFKRKAACWRYA